MASKTFKLPNWDAEPLNLFLKRVFPGYISPYQRLDIQRIRVDLEPKKSHEAVYKWLRKGELKPENAQALMALANKPENIAARVAAGQVEYELTLQDFTEFVFKPKTT